MLVDTTGEEAPVELPTEQHAAEQPRMELQAAGQPGPDGATLFQMLEQIWKSFQAHVVSHGAASAMVVMAWLQQAIDAFSRTIDNVMNGIYEPPHSSSNSMDENPIPNMDSTAVPDSKEKTP